jgi:hypothetical protein
MAIVYPLDILATWPGWTTEFEQFSRDELSRQTNGVTRSKNLGSPLWRLSAVTRSLSINLLDEWRARLNALESGQQQFKGYSLSRCFPIAYPGGTWPTGGSFDGISATVYAVGSGNKSLRVDLLPAGFQLRVGDLLQVAHGDDLDVYGVQEAVTASAGGITPEFEVRPHLWPGVAVDNLVSVKRPWCSMTIVPGSISSSADLQTGRGTISFQAMESR